MSVRPPPTDVLVRWYPWIWHFAQVATFAYYRAPFRVSSWYRDPDHNASVGGNADSQHLIATAADLVPLSGSVEDLARELRAVGLVAVTYPSHVHAQLFRAGQRPNV